MINGFHRHLLKRTYTIENGGQVAMCGQSLGKLHTIMRTMLAVVFGVKSEADFEKRISSESTSYPYSYKRKKTTNTFS